MLMVISPAKTLDFESLPKTKVSSIPAFLSQSEKLVVQLRELSPQDISALMGISDKLGLLNFERFANWHTPFDNKNAKQAILAFKGDVYTGLAAETFTSRDFTFAQQHLRILSGLYGLLRPLDLIQAYRLEMGSKFQHDSGKNLYQLWSDEITGVLNDQLKDAKSSVLVNLASNEYFKVIDKKNLRGEIITPVFKDFKNGKYKIISFYAKKARGMMSAYIIKNRIDNVEDIKQFDEAGYRYSEEMSSPREWVFTRDPSAL